jgi:hypothetical protein
MILRFYLFISENAFLLATTLRGSTKPTVSILELVQNERVGVLSTMSSIYSMSFILTKLKQREQK